MATVFYPSTRVYARTFEYNRFRQKGLCRLCKTAINFGETIIGTGDRKRKYYHEACAKKVMIILD